MGQRLREVPEERRCRRIDLLGVQADIVLEPDQLVQQFDRLLAAAGQSEDLREPERAAEERSLFSPEIVVAHIQIEEWDPTELSSEDIDRPGVASPLWLARAELGPNPRARCHALG